MTGVLICDLDGEVERCVACVVLEINIAAVGFDEKVDILD